MQGEQNKYQPKTQPPANTARRETKGGTSGSWDGFLFSDWHKNPVPITGKSKPSKYFFPPDREGYVFKPDLKD